MAYARFGVTIVVMALTTPTPARADDPEYLTGNVLEGPFATRDEACEAVLLAGTCTTYRTLVTPAATSGWGVVELGVVNDHRSKTTKHFGLFVTIGKQWFARSLGTDGSVDTEFFPRCKPDGGEGSCTPFHRDMPAHYKVPKLSWVDVAKGGAKERVMFYPTPSDVGFRAFAPTAELVQVCGLAANIPSCTETFIAVSRSRARAKSPADLFTNGSVVLPGDVQQADGTFQSSVAHLKF